VKIVRGFVEVLDEALYWHSTLRVNALVGQAPDITSILFGVDDHWVKKPVKPIASNRGFPEDASMETKAAYQADQPDAHFATYIKPAEIAEVFEIKELKKGWPIVFAFMGVLAELYGDNSVRLVCWFIG
jgi:hypothetical protein